MTASIRARTPGFRGALLAATVSLLGAGELAAQTIRYVDVDHPSAVDSAAGGTATVPWKTLTYALGTSGVAPGERLHVRSGNYDADATTDGVAESFPILLPPRVEIFGVNDSDLPPSLSEFPNVGGSAAGAATHLFEIDATGGNHARTVVQNLRFIGENSPGLDSPVALRADVASGWSANLQFLENVCERPYLNSTGIDGLATLHLEVDEGDMGGLIADSVIEVSTRGGIELVSQQNQTTLSGQSDFTLDVEDNFVTNTGGSFATFGIRWHAPSGNATAFPGLDVSHVTGNQVISIDDGIQKGIEFHAEEFTNFGQDLNIIGNVVQGCASSGIVLRADGWTTGGNNLPEIAGDVNLNVVTDNGGSGVALVWDESNTDGGRGYLAINLKGNVIADNAGLGIHARNWGRNSVGFVNSNANTIAYNDAGAEGYTNLLFGGTPFGPLSGHINDIGYFNNPTSPTTWGPQIVGLSASELALTENAIQSSDWQGIASCATSCTNGNIDADPKLVGSASGIYRIAVNSPALEAGNNSNADLPVDIDNQPRILDGNCDGQYFVDMGADEYRVGCGP